MYLSSCASYGTKDGLNSVITKCFCLVIKSIPSATMLCLKDPQKEGDTIRPRVCNLKYQATPCKKITKIFILTGL